MKLSIEELEKIRQAKEIYHSLGHSMTTDDLDVAYTKGMIRKENLKDGMIYEGHCRNASQARWEESRQKFVYIRYKFNSRFEEDIVHPVDDEGFDIFIPMKEITKET